MARASKKIRFIEFKGTTLPVVSVLLRSLHPEQLATSATELFGDEAFFEGDAAVLELDLLSEATDGDLPEQPDWAAIVALFAHHGLQVIGVSGGSEALRASAADAGLPGFAAFRRPARAEATPVTDDAADEPQSEEQQSNEPDAAAASSAAAMPTPAPTLIIDRPLRSGQQAYARGGDLVMLAAVNAGAEVIADGSIHVYAPLRGRALAGASGDAGARIFTTRFEAELVSVAGVYRTFESGIPGELAKRPTQIRLCLGESEGEDHLDIQPLKTD